MCNTQGQVSQGASVGLPTGLLQRQPDCREHLPSCRTNSRATKSWQSREALTVKSPWRRGNEGRRVLQGKPAATGMQAVPSEGRLCHPPDHGHPAPPPPGDALPVLPARGWGRPCLHPPFYLPGIIAASEEQPEQCLPCDGLQTSLSSFFNLSLTFPTLRMHVE